MVPATGIFSLPFREWCPLRVYSVSQVCLPHYNPAAFLYTYITYVAGGICLLLLSSAPDSFYELAAARVTIETNLKKQSVVNAVSTARSYVV